MLTEAGTVAARESVPGVSWPRITLVTAVYNGERFLEATMHSVLSQGYPNLEYIVVNDGSTDGTVEIIRKYEKNLTGWISQPNKGLYGALNEGFARSSGEIMGWLNASDLLHTNGLFVVGSVFATLPEVEWITGRPTRFNQKGLTVDIRPLPRWSQYRYLAGANQYIQQESTFWRRSLWNRAGSALDASYRVEGDFDLWVRLFRHARLYSVDALIGGYRFHEDAISWSNLDSYNQTCDGIVERELESVRWGKLLKAFRRVSRAVGRVPKARGVCQRLVMKALYRIPGPDWPRVIEDQGGKWVLRA